MVGVVGQPDARLGEVPCAYVELVGEHLEVSDLLEHAKNNIGEKAAIPKNVDIVEEMPKTYREKSSNQSSEKSHKSVLIML